MIRGPMAILSRIEAFLERLFQAPAGRFGARLQPVTLAKRIERAMDTNKSFSNDGVLVPNHYDLHLSPADYATFDSYRGSLEDDLAHGVLSRARHERYTLVARPRVRLLSDQGIPRGDLRVAAAMIDDHGSRVRRDESLPSSDTMVFARPEQSASDQSRPDSAVRAYLLVSTAGRPPIQFDLGDAVISIGRSNDNDVIVDDGEVSRHHCQLKLQHGAYSLADLGSRNGSFVNGQPVSEIALGPGDVIRIGSTLIEFQVRG
jgi:hypothetical protein